MYAKILYVYGSKLYFCRMICYTTTLIAKYKKANTCTIQVTDLNVTLDAGEPGVAVKVRMPTAKQLNGQRCVAVRFNRVQHQVPTL